MKTLKLLSNKVILSLGAVLVLAGSLATAPHTWFYNHEEECPEEILRDE